MFSFINLVIFCLTNGNFLHSLFFKQMLDYKKKNRRSYLDRPLRLTKVIFCIVCWHKKVMCINSLYFLLLDIAFSTVQTFEYIVISKLLPMLLTNSSTSLNISLCTNKERFGCLYCSKINNKHYFLIFFNF